MSKGSYAGGAGWPLAGLTAHLLQACDAFFQRRVRAEQVGHAAAAEAEQRRDDEHLLGAGVAVLHGDLSAGHAQLVQGTGQGQGLAADAGAGLVGQVLTRAGDGHLDDAGGDGGQDGQQERGDGVGAAFLVIAAAAEDGGELHEVGDADDDRGQHTGDGLDQDVTVGDVADLVGDDAAQLFGAEDAHDAVGDGHHTVLGVAAGGEGVGRVFGDDTDAGLGDAGIGGGGYTVNAGKPTIVFTASNGNSFYSGDKLQVPALSVLACIKA